MFANAAAALYSNRVLLKIGHVDEVTSRNFRMNVGRMLLGQGCREVGRRWCSGEGRRWVMKRHFKGMPVM